MQTYSGCFKAGVMSLRVQAAAVLTSAMHACVQDASEQLEHANTKEDGYSILQTMLATLGEPIERIASQFQVHVYVSR